MIRDEIINRLKLLYQFHTDTELAKFLGTTKQNVSNYRKKSTTDMQTNIIVKLLNKLEQEETTAADMQAEIVDKVLGKLKRK